VIPRPVNVHRTARAATTRVLRECGYDDAEARRGSLSEKWRVGMIWGP
jgi:hypothetical protein